MKDNNKNWKRFMAILGPRNFYGLFAGRPELVNGIAWRVPESSPFKEHRWFRREEVEDAIREYQRKGWTVWIYINDIERGHMLVDNVRHVGVIFFDIDAPRTDKTRPATGIERILAELETERLKKYLEDAYGARGFAAVSGNGLHLYYPIHPLKLPTSEESWAFNNRLKKWMRELRRKSGVAFDAVYNLNRVVQPVGFPNVKIPNMPLATFWIDKFSIADIEDARDANRVMVGNILKEITEGNNITAQVKSHPSLNQLLRNDPWLRDMCTGNWAKYGYLSRSEAELAVVRELVHWGFTDWEIHDIMRHCGIGKWPTAGESYRRNTIRKARLWEERKRR